MGIQRSAGCDGCGRDVCETQFSFDYFGGSDGVVGDSVAGVNFFFFGSNKEFSRSVRGIFRVWGIPVATFPFCLSATIIMLSVGPADKPNLRWIEAIRPSEAVRPEENSKNSSSVRPTGNLIILDET